MIQNLDFPFRAKDNQENVPNLTKVDVTSASLTFTTYRTGANNTLADVVDTFTLNNIHAPAAPEQVTDLVVNVGTDETQRLVTWYSASDETGEVQLATASAMTGTDFPATYQSFAAVRSNSSFNGFYTYKASVTGLEPNTDYVYRVGNADGWSGVYHLTTKASVTASASCSPVIRR
jgi:hypothetical protein